MAEHHNQQQYYQQPQQQLPPPHPSSERRIVRSSSGRDRHSKVSTAKGLRDRRVRLSAHTAIRFYDVQDRLGYDRPSKAVDWLIRNARAAIDELPPCPPAGEGALETAGPSTSVAGYGFDSNFLPTTLDSDAIAETIKSFFPVSHAAAPPNFQGYPPQAMPYNTGSQVHEDLRLSLQSSNHPITTTITTTTTTGDTIVLDAASGSWTHASSSPKMSSWVVDGSALETALGQGSAWINDHNQMQISTFGSAGFSNCYQIDEDHNDISPTNRG